MLTKEFAQRVELSEKQVRKIVQHLEERGYQLSKTEYRGREATDFKEEDIELFQEIAEKVKQTNSYDLAFEELEKEKDFLQVLVKENDSNLPTDQNVSKLVDDLRSEIQKMRDERQMLGQMINQVHQQQNELHEMQNQITSKLDANTESLKAIQTSTDEIKTTQSVIQDSQKEQSELVKSNVETDHISASTGTTAGKGDKLTDNTTEQASAATHPAKDSKVSTENTSNPVQVEDSEITQVGAQPSTVAKPATDDSKATTSETAKETDTTSTSITASSEEKDTTSVDKTKDDSVQKTPDNDHATDIASSSEQEAASEQTHAYESPLAKEEPKDERKGFFARLFNL
ncbi:hypothetical protein M4L39_02020 [Staphylococcus equorum]|uniref:DNA-binding protein n=1 Tax=Staphylococcus equorum TaxID=246432 RepID=A0A9X4L769_9STAP|nr:hypothetical protein [Staphylococcus equorum]MDG0842200.1 hypothetical protein [Staphylococcus equorum]MDG0857749.1 hypothetical protein [Staphylococcus equorum]